jgi:peroxiredoxin
MAPVFELPSTVGEKVNLADHMGKSNIILAFYFHDFTGICTKEMCGFSDDMSAMAQMQAQVFGISVDSIHSHKAFAEKNNIKIPLLSDFNKDASRMYGVLGDWGFEKGISKRSVFLIGKDGKVKYRWVSEKPGVEPNVQEVKDALSKL